MLAQVSDMLNLLLQREYFLLSPLPFRFNPFYLRLEKRAQICNDVLKFLLDVKRADLIQHF